MFFMFLNSRWSASCFLYRKTCNPTNIYGYIKVDIKCMVLKIW